MRGFFSLGLHASAGVQINVLPSHATASFDIRVAPGVDLDTFKATLEQWAAEAVCGHFAFNSADGL